MGSGLSKCVGGGRLAGGTGVDTPVTYPSSVFLGLHLGMHD